MKRILPVLILTVLLFASCGGGGGSNNYTIKLIKTDGTEVDANATPIPIGTAIKLIFSPAVGASDQAAIEAAFKLYAPASVEVAGTFSWNTAGTEMTFTPSSRLAYKTTYTINVTASASVSTEKGISAGTASFVTMTYADINGDGYSDVAIGAPDAGASKNGAVYVFLGGTDLSGALFDAAANAIISGQADSALGKSVNISGDYNGDGYADLIASAPDADGGGANKGQVYVLLGSADGIASCDLSASPACVPTATISGAQDSDTMGNSIAPAGDVTGDRLDDIVIGASSAFTGATRNGRVYMFSGGATLTGDLTVSNALATITGDNDSSAFGGSVFGAGDVNGDHVDDILVGQPQASISAEIRGKAYIFNGGSALIGSLSPANASAMVSGESGASQLGISVAGVGDVNNDGFGDVIIGSIESSSSKGRAFLFTGSASGISSCDLAAGCTAHATITGDLANDELSKSVAPAGDVNGDGFDDVLIGAPAGGAAGYATVFLGGTTLSGNLGPANAATVIKGLNNAIFGDSVNTAGDVTGDGYYDIIVGAPDDNAGGTARGASYVFIGSASGITSCDLSVNPTCPRATVNGVNDNDNAAYVR